MYTVKKTCHKKRSYRTGTVSTPLNPSVALLKGIIAIFGWEEPLLSISVCILSAYNVSKMPIVTRLQTRIQNLIFLSQYIELLLHGRRVFVTKSLLHPTVPSWMFMIMLVQWYINTQQVFIWFVICGTKQCKEFWNPLTLTERLE
jgi:hypothetical protein